MSYTEAEIHQIVESQKRFFRSGKTLDLSWRITQLKRLRKEVKGVLPEDTGYSDTGAVAAVREIRRIPFELQRLLYNFTFSGIFRRRAKLFFS